MGKKSSMRVQFSKKQFCAVAVVLLFLFSIGHNANWFKNIKIMKMNALIEEHRQRYNKVPIYVFETLLQQDTEKVGTFVEFGCADGTTNSNTYPFERMGWRGLCIEPNFENYEKAKKKRKNVIHALITSSKKQFTYAEMSGSCDQFSGIIEFYSPEFNDLLEDCEKKGLVKRISMPGVPLADLLAEYKMTTVDWISIDCEGCEHSFITSFNFTKYGVQLVNYEPNTAAELHRSEIEEALFAHKFLYDQELQDRIFRQPGKFLPRGI